MGGTRAHHKEAQMSTMIEQVEVLLEIAGITPRPDEIEQLATTYAQMRADIEHLWSLDLGDTPPALVFRAAEASDPQEVTSRA